ncbi:MAG: sensor domain-containing diguanylate cyclase [Actinomycetes bacterium]
MPKEPSSSTSRLRAATLQVAPFGVAGLVAPLVSLGGDGQAHPGPLLAGLALTLAGLTALTLAVARRSHRLTMNLTVYVWLGALTLLVYGTGGADSGATLVLFLPALWVSLYGERLDALITLALMLAAVIAVTVLDGASDLTTTDVRRIIVFTAVPALAVWAISTLVQRQGASEQEAREAQQTLTQVASAAQRIRQDSDPRGMACRALREVSGASIVLILEPDGSHHLRRSASLGIEHSDRRLSLSEPSLDGEAYVGGRPIYVPDTHRDPRASSAPRSEGDTRSILVHPFGHDGVVHGVLHLAWRDRRPNLPNQTSAAVTLLAQEIGWAIERADMMNTLRHSATTDSLTGMGNRRAWRERVPELLDAPLCIAIADLDHFKTYNDSFGHLAGDTLLKSLGEKWQRLIRPDDLLVRWGGEEFAIALPDCTPDQAVEVLERLKAGVPMGQTVSIGLAARRIDEPIDVTMARADASLYQAKNSGRNRICINAHEPRRPAEAAYSAGAEA